MVRDHAMYRPRHAEASVLHAVIRQHLEGFLRTAADRADGAGLPEFIAREFREFLICGVLAHGFARVRCASCALERLVPFSCKGRGFCPSCGGRMTERAAHLVDDILPPVPVRQWVLTLPYRLGYLLAWDHGLTRAVLAVYSRALLGFYRRQANRNGIRDGRTGMLTVIQRFGSGLNLNVHFHTLVFDGVFRRTGAGGLAFHPACPPRDAEVVQVLDMIRRRVGRLLRHRGLEPGDEGPGPDDSLAETSRVLAGIVGASVQGRVALGPQAGARVRRLGDLRCDPGATPGAHRGLRPARQRVGGGPRPGASGTAVPLPPPPATGRRPAATARRRPRARATEAGVERRHDAPTLRARGVPRKAGGAHAAAGDQPDPLPRRPRGARALTAKAEALPSPATGRGRR